ncbi:MAG: hypothetical protein A2X94_03980 [Bdellovibrionales bacterium GWB1_55_8]|nr:MAG: hypothetical protein A2X94_03980 [Bdellovibrionales bacterium GWB1_55_8]
MTTPSNELRANVYQKLGQIAQAMSSPARLKIIQILAQGPRTVEEISQSSGESVANTSQHLQRLAREGLVAMTKRGLSRIYRVKNPKVIEIWERIQDLAHEIAPQLNEAEDELTESALRSPTPANEVVDSIRKRKAVLVDVREVHEAEATPVPGAKNIPLARLKQELKTLEKDKTIYVFCRGKYCELASHAVRALRNAGFKAFRLRESSFRLNQMMETP